VHLKVLGYPEGNSSDAPFSIGFVSGLEKKNGVNA